MHSNELLFSEGFQYMAFTDFFPISCIQRYKCFQREILKTIPFKCLLLKGDLPEPRFFTTFLLKQNSTTKESFVTKEDKIEENWGE